MMIDSNTLTHQLVDTGTLRLHVVEKGEGPVVILLHGFPDFWYSWRNQIDALADQGFRVIVPDLRGYNSSDKPTSVADYRIDSLAKDVVGLIQSIGEGPVRLVGHDWGGIIAWLVANDYPEYVEQLVVMNIPHPQKILAGLKTFSQALRFSYLLFFQLPWLPERVLSFDRFRFLKWFLKKEGQRRGGFSDEDVSRLTAFTSQISIGIENASLFDNIQSLMNYNESMLNSMSNGVITVDGDGIVEKCNPAGIKILKIESEENILKKEFKTIFKGKNKWIVEKVSKVEDIDFLPDAELEFGGEKISCNLTIMPLTGGENESLGMLLMIEDISSEKRMKSTMSRYMDADLADQLLEAGDGDDMMGGKESIGTVLFSDIRSFTTLTESLGAQGTVGFLNDYFTVMVDCIQDEGGMLDKFIGDAIMAIFGTPVAHDDDPDRGLRAAIQMMHGLNEFNEIRKSQGLPPVDHGMGLNTDEIVSGNIGSPKRMDYTVIGDGVNLAARIESSCKKYGAKILMSEYTFEALKATYRTRQVDCVIVKGKTEPVRVFEVLDYHSKESFPNMIEVLEMFNNGMEYYNEGNWDKAIAQFKKAQKGNPDDKASNMYVERCGILKKRDPKDWDGVWVATSK